MGYVQNADALPTKLGAVKILKRGYGWSYRSIDNPNELADGFTEEEKWSFLSGGIQTEELDATDVSELVTIGPITIDPFRQVVLCFAVIAAGSEVELQAAADLAQELWDQAVPAGLNAEVNRGQTAIVFTRIAPNPFNPGTSVEFMLPQSETVTLSIYDLFGRKIETLVSGRLMPGTHRFDWDASNRTGGVYWCQLRTAGGVVDTKKLLLLK